MTQGTSIPLLLNVRVAVLSEPVLDPTVIGKLAMYLVLPHPTAADVYVPIRPPP